MKKLLFIAKPDSIHTTRWINQLVDAGWELHIYGTYESFWHQDLKNIILYSRKDNPSLVEVIRKIKPDLIHSMEMLGAGQLTLDAKKYYGEKFPKWICTNWGSDIYLFGRLKEFKNNIVEILSHCDYYSCECHRDVALAREYGFKGEVLPVVPNAGGFHIENLETGVRPSCRKQIILKGYQGWAGRALVGLRALERCADILQGYELKLYSANSKEMKIATELFSQSVGIPTTIIPHMTPHWKILKNHGNSRIYIGLSISDAISTSLLEAMVMGAFPIQSWTSAADEWIEDGVSGILVPPEDPEIVEKAIRRALSNDELVDQGAIKNLKVSKEKLDYCKIKSEVLDFYRSIL